MSPPAASTAAARTVAPPAPRPRRLKATGAATRRAPAQTRRTSTPPRRVSGPTRKRTAPRQVAPAPAWRRASANVAGAAMRVPDHPLLDRLVRGRFWIALVGAALIGMVAMQVAMLRINSDIGRYVDKAADLQRANAVLSAANSRLATVSRIESEGARLGLVLPHPDGVRYLYARPGIDAAQAVATMRAPSPASPVTQTATTTPVQTTVTSPATTQVAAGATAPQGATPPATGTVAQSPTQSQGTSTGGP